MPTSDGLVSEETRLLPGGLETSNTASRTRKNANAHPTYDDEANHGPRTSLLYKLFMVISATATLTSSLILVSQVASLIVLQGLFIQHVLRIYLIVFSLMFILAELQVQFFLDRATYFKNWFHRGFLYTFVAVISMEESKAALGQAYPKYPNSVELVLSNLLMVASVAMFSLGLLYMVMGIFCLRGVWEDLQNKYRRQAMEPTATLDV